MNISTAKATHYTANSVPCQIKFTGEHQKVSQYLKKTENNDEIVTYIRGYKLHGKPLVNKELKGYLVSKDLHSDDLQSHGTIDELIYFERDGVEVKTPAQINELLQLSNIVSLIYLNVYKLY